MATRLSLTSSATKKGAIFLGVAIVVFIIARLLFGVAVTVLTPPKPSPTPYINAKFQVLPPLSLPDSVVKSEGKNIILDTITGDIPVSTGSAVVYKINTTTRPDLNFGQKSKQIASQFQFVNTDPTKVGGTTYLFQDPQDINRQLDLDYLYYNYKFNFVNPSSYVSIEKGNTIPIERATSLSLESLKNTRNDIKTTEINEKNQNALTTNGQYIFLDPVTQQTQAATTIQSANITSININRQPINSIPIIGPSTTKSNINFSYTGLTSSGQFQVSHRLLEANVTYWNYSPSTEAVYLLQSASDAFNNDLLQGKGYILNKTQDGDEYHVRKVYLAYYEPPTVQEYLIPVWVYEGDKTDDAKFLFRAIVPAIAKGFIQE
ncbi:MAG: hypothetical protein M3P33_04040 [bacterium]|nr:hypothetical protein [bacterium]